MIKNKIAPPAGHKAPTIEIKNISATHPIHASLSDN